MQVTHLVEGDCGHLCTAITKCHTHATAPLQERHYDTGQTVGEKDAADEEPMVLWCRHLCPNHIQRNIVDSVAKKQSSVFLGDQVDAECYNRKGPSWNEFLEVFDAECCMWKELSQQMWLSMVWSCVVLLGLAVTVWVLQLWWTCYPADIWQSGQKRSTERSKIFWTMIDW